MDNLRLILIIGGVVLLAGIYLWGVAFANRRESRVIEDDAADPLDDDLESIQDLRAAQNVEALVNLENFDIDEDLERDVPGGEPLGERRPKPADIETESNEISADGTEEIVVDDDDAGDGAEAEHGRASVRIDEDDIPDVGEIDFEPFAEDLSGIRATREADDEVPIGQLDLLRLDEERDRPEPPVHAATKEAKARGGKKADAAAVETTAVAITVMAREGERFAGADLRRLLQSLNLEHGEMGIFHRRERGKPRRAPPVYSVANVVQPGTFELGAMDDITTPGVALFVQLPGPEDPGAAFEDMIRAARTLADGLNGIVCDDTRSTLTGQVINHLRERISEFSRKQRLRH